MLKGYDPEQRTLLDFHHQTKHHRQEFWQGMRVGMPLMFKSYPRTEVITLPREFPSEGPSLFTVIQKRRSRREYLPHPISLLELSQLLFFSYGPTELTYAYGVRDFPLRAAPSAGALYPIEVYPIVNYVEGLPMGLYHYRTKDHSLEKLCEKDFREEIVRACMDQDFMARAAVIFALTAVYERCMWKYLVRSYRYIHLDCGHLAQNLYLLAEALNLGACDIGAFYDDEVNNLLNLNPQEEFTVLLVTVGKVRT